MAYTKYLLSYERYFEVGGLSSKLCSEILYKIPFFPSSLNALTVTDLCRA